MSSPVTVSITRHVDPAHADQMLAWIRAGSALAVGFPGFLGTGWVRGDATSDEWHMLYRFADDPSLQAWEESSQRRWWLGAAQGLVGESRLERRTGIEGWFDEPSTYDVRDLRPAAPAPPRWKQATMIWLAFFPLNLLATVLVSRLLPDLPVLPRVLGTTLVMTPVMVYLVLPQMTRLLGWWLAGDPPPWRATRS